MIPLVLTNDRLHPRLTDLSFEAEHTFETAVGEDVESIREWLYDVFYRHTEDRCTLVEMLEELRARKYMNKGFTASPRARNNKKYARTCEIMAQVIGGDPILAGKTRHAEYLDRLLLDDCVTGKIVEKIYAWAATYEDSRERSGGKKRKLHRHAEED